METNKIEIKQTVIPSGAIVREADDTESRDLLFATSGRKTGPTTCWVIRFANHPASSSACEAPITITKGSGDAWQYSASLPLRKSVPTTTQSPARYLSPLHASVSLKLSLIPSKLFNGGDKTIAII